MSPNIKDSYPRETGAPSTPRRLQSRAGKQFEKWWAGFEKNYAHLEPRLAAWYAWVAAINWVAPHDMEPWK